MITQVQEQEEMAKLYKTANAFVKPSRSEEAIDKATLEAMAMELPVIATRYGANEEFLNKNNSILVGIDGYVSSTQHDKRFSLESVPAFEQVYSSPSKSELQAKMRMVYNGNTKLKTIAKNARRTVLEKYTIQAENERMLTRLAQVKQKYLNKRK